MDDRRIPPGGLNVKCPKCKGVFPVRPPRPIAAPAPESAPPVVEATAPAPVADTPAPVADTPAPAALDAGGFDPAFAAFDAPSGELVSNDGTLSWTAPGEPFAAPTGAERGGDAAPASADEPDPFSLPPPQAPSFATEDRFEDPAAALDVEQPAPPAPGGLGPIGASASQELEALFSADAGPERTEILAGPRPAAPPPAPVRRPTPVLGRNAQASDGEGAAPRPARRKLSEVFRALFRRDGGASARRATAPASGRLSTGAIRASAPAPRGVDDAPSAEPAASRLRRAVPALAIAAVVLVVVGLGVGAGFTRYGFFFQRAITGKLGPNRPGAALLREARARLAQGTFPATSSALRLAEQALQLDSSDLEAGAVLVQAAARLQRDHGGGAEAFARAPEILARLARDAPDDVQGLQARVAAALAPGAPVPLDSESALERHLATSPGDTSIVQLLAEAAASKHDVPRAASLFERAAEGDPRSARAPHGLGLVLAAAGDRAGATLCFEKALARDPAHLSSSVELAALAVGAGELDRARSILDGVLADEARAGLGPRERSRARTLRATVLARTAGDDPGASLDAARKELDLAIADDPTYALPRVTLARMLVRRGDPAAALAALGPAAAEAPDVRALALAADGKLLDAMNAVDAALAARPSDARLLHVKGVVAAAAHKPAEAEKAWADAIARDPSRSEPRIALARARLAAGDQQSAVDAANAALERAPGDADVLAVLGEVALARGDAAGARSAFEKSLRLDPTLAEAHVGLAHVALAARDDASAEAHLRRALALAPRMRDARRMLGELLWRKGDLAGARDALAEAVALDPKDAIARARLGAVELERGNVDAALSELLAASNADERDPVARLWYGRALLAKGETGAAVEQLRKAVDLAPDSAEAHLWLGAAHERAGSATEAAASYRAASARNPKLLEPRERLATLLGMQGRWADSSAELERAIAIAPAEPRLRIALGDARMQMGRQPEAVRIYRSVLETDPKQVALNYKIARALHESSGMRAALPWYEKAAALDAANGMSHYYLGFAYKDLHQRARAAAEFRTYLAKRPDAEDRRDIEREIEDLRVGEP